MITVGSKISFLRSAVTATQTAKLRCFLESWLSSWLVWSDFPQDWPYCTVNFLVLAELCHHLLHCFLHWNSCSQELLGKVISNPDKYFVTRGLVLVIFQHNKSTLFICELWPGCHFALVPNSRLSQLRITIVWLGWMYAATSPNLIL